MSIVQAAGAPSRISVDSSIYTYLINLNINTLDLPQIDQKLHILLQSDIKWATTQREGIHLTRYYIRRLIHAGTLKPQAFEFKPISRLLKSWFWTSHRGRVGHKASCDVIHLLLVTQRAEIQLPREVVRYISLFFKTRPAPPIPLE